MATTLTAVFELIDKMSDKMDAIANGGENVITNWERMGDAADHAQEIGVAAAAEVAHSVVNYSNAMENAAGTTDYWTEAIGNFDKSAMEATFTTEELVEMGYKSAKALEEERSVLELAQLAMDDLNNATETSITVQNRLEDAMSKAAQVAETVSENDRISEQVKEALQDATEKATAAFEEFEAAQKAAQDAMDNYNAVAERGTATITELEAAALDAATAADNLVAANDKAAAATDELSKVSGDAADEFENVNDKGVGAIEGIASALATAGITATVLEISSAVYGMADSFSEAEKTIAIATGETGRELDALMDSSLDVYAHSSAESLNDVAGGMTAVKAATGLVGDELEETTGYALALENSLGYGIPESARTAGVLMKNFNITAEEAYGIIATGAQNGADKNGDLLDVLNEYSAQYSALDLSANEFLMSLVNGADAGVFSIDRVGDAVKEFNIRAKDGSDTTAEAFELLGMDADIMSAKFAAGGETARTAFYDVVNALDDMSDPLEKNTAAVNLFGTQYEDLGEDILPVLAGIENGAIDTESALTTMTDEAKSLGDEWQEAGNSISTAFTTAVEPTISDVSETLAEATQDVGEFLNEHPNVTKAITGIGIGLGTATIGIAGVAAASVAATPLVANFAIALNSAIWPLTAVAAAVAAMSAAVLILKDNYDEAYDETMSMTAVTAKQTDELEELQKEYEDVCERYGETSDEAASLRYQIDDLSDSIENNGQSVEEFVAELDDLIAKHDEIIQSYEETAQSIENEELNNLALIAKLEDLAEASDKSAGSQQAMQTIIDDLNESISGLNLTYDDLINNQDAAMDSLKDMAQAQADRERQMALWDEYVALLGQVEQEEKAVADANAEASAAYERYNDAYAAYMDKFFYYDRFSKDEKVKPFRLDIIWADETANKDAALDAWNTVNDAATEAQEAYSETVNRIEEIERELGITSDTQNKTTEATMSYEQAAATAYSAVKSDIEELCAAYDEAYEAAKESFEGQFGLFEEASTQSEEYLNSSVANAQEALDSQLTYWTEYNANLDALTAYGEQLTGEAKANYDALLEYAQSGSEEAAGLADSIAQAIESGNVQTISELANTLAEVREQQDQAAQITADWQTDFTEKMNQLQQEMEDTIDGLELSDEAEAAAMETINSYAETIRAGKADAVAAAQEVANAVAAVLARANVEEPDYPVFQGAAPANTSAAAKVGTAVTGSLTGNTDNDYVFAAINGHAEGTVNAPEDVFIAGEEGPELIVGQQGSTVFPTAETQRIINAVNGVTDGNGLFVPYTQNTQGTNIAAYSGTKALGDKKITLEIEGKGNIELTGGKIDEETLLSFLYENLRPVLLAIIKQELYEEGDYSYGY